MCPSLALLLFTESYNDKNGTSRFLRKEAHHHDLSVNRGKGKREKIREMERGNWTSFLLDSLLFPSPSVIAVAAVNPWTNGFFFWKEKEREVRCWMAVVQESSSLQTRHRKVFFSCRGRGSRRGRRHIRIYYFLSFPPRSISICDCGEGEGRKEGGLLSFSHH